MSLLEEIALLPDEDRDNLLDSLNDAQLALLLQDPAIYLRPEQKAPQWDWLYWLVMTGRGWGKGTAGSNWIHDMADTPGERMAIVGETYSETRHVVIEGPSGILNTQRPWNPVTYESSPTLRRLTWANGSTAIHFSGDNPNQLRGVNASKILMDEFAKYRYPGQVLSALDFILRIGKRIRMMVTTTPQPITEMQQLIDHPLTHLTTGSTYDNVANLNEVYINVILQKYEGTRLGEQEIYGRMLTDRPGALWTRELLDQTRVQSLPSLVMITIGVDPSGGSADCGIGVAGLGTDGHGYVIEDHTQEPIRIPGEQDFQVAPEIWGAAIVQAWQRYKPHLPGKGQSPVVCIETNYGGNMCMAVLRIAAEKAGLQVAEYQPGQRISVSSRLDETIPVQRIAASESKWARAMPIKMLYEQGRCHNLGTLGKLEGEMCQWLPTDKLSPNRLDAIVHALSQFMLDFRPKSTIAPPVVVAQPSRWSM